MVVIGADVVVVVDVIPVVDPRNIPLRFGKNQVINRWDFVDVVSVFVFVVVVVILLLVVLMLILETYLKGRLKSGH